MTTTALPRSTLLTALPHSGMSVGEYYGMHFQGALFPAAAGVLLYGWRAAETLGLVLVGAAGATAVWRRVGARGPQLRLPHTLWLAMLLGLMLPAHLASTQPAAFGMVPWPLLPAAGVILVILMWLLGGLGAGRIHPALVTYLLLAALFGPLLEPHWVLQRGHLGAGDLLRGRAPDVRVVRKEPWINRRGTPEYDAEDAEPAADGLARYTSGQERPPRGWLSLPGLVRDVMPPLEDLIIGGQPGPAGTTSGLAVIIGGLFLLYRGLIDFRIPLLIVLVAFLAFLILPVPVQITQLPQWRWAAFRQADIGWPTAITFANYELMASPLLFMAFFVATSPVMRPMSRRARVLYAAAAGLLTAAFQLYMSVSFGPYLAVLLASLLTPAFDRWFRPRPLV